MHAKIVSFSQHQTHVEYVVSLKDRETCFEKAKFPVFFSELALLHRKILNSQGNAPEIPLKFQSFGRTLENVEERAGKIEQYLNDLLKISDFVTKTAVEAFIREKTTGFYDFFKEMGQKTEIFQEKTQKIRVFSKENEKTSEETSIFQGKEYVVEGEIDENSGSLEEISFDPLKKRKKIGENREKNAKKPNKTLNFCQRMFISCCNYS